MEKDENKGNIKIRKIIVKFASDTDVNVTEFFKDYKLFVN